MSMPPDDLPRDIRELLRRNRGVVLAADATKAGVSESRLRRLAAANKLRRLAPGAYVDAKAFVALGDWQRFMLEARAFALMCGPDSFLTGWGCRLPDSLVVADEAARRALDLVGVLPHMRRWQGINRATWVAERAEPTVESPLETLGAGGQGACHVQRPSTQAGSGEVVEGRAR